MDIRIDRLRLQVAGMNPDTARQFGRLLAEQLAAMVAAAPPAPPAPGAARRSSLRVSVPWPAGRHSGGLAPVAATEISRALRTATTGTTPMGTTPMGTAAAARTAPTTRPGAAR
ncbi:MAG: hypothetical protein ACRDOI_11075 [Trebonia sp.]